MADSWKKPCTWRGCPELVSRGQRLCEKHRKLYQKKQAQENRKSNPEEQRFYNSPEWERLTRAHRASEPFCRECAKRGKQTFGEVTDHIIPLKVAWAMRLDSLNLQTMCHPCHNRKRALEAKMARSTEIPALPCTLVCGPPASGKTTYVQKRAQRGDIILDLDLIFSALTGLPVHDKPEALLGIALEARNAALMRVALMGADRPRTWIIATAPSRSDRQVYKNLFKGLKVVILDTPAVVCMERIAKDPVRTNQWAQFKEIVEEWFDNFEGEESEDEGLSV